MSPLSFVTSQLTVSARMNCLIVDNETASFPRLHRKIHVSVPKLRTRIHACRRHAPPRQKFRRCLLIHLSCGAARDWLHARIAIERIEPPRVASAPRAIPTCDRCVQLRCQERMTGAVCDGLVCSRCLCVGQCHEARAERPQPVTNRAECIAQLGQLSATCHAAQGCCPTCPALAWTPRKTI
jgi:hypothetical protein